MFRLGEVQHGVIDAVREVGPHTLTLRARQVRQKGGDTYCLLALMDGSLPVHSDTVWVDDADSRYKFLKALYGTGRKGPNEQGKLPAPIQAAFPSAVFDHEMMLWSRALWPRYIGATAGAYIDADAEPSAPRWAIPGLILDGQTSIWAGDRGANKSTLMRLVCQSLEHGSNAMFEQVTDRVPCIWVNAEEDPQEHTRQMGNVNQALGIERTAPTFTIHARGMAISDLALRLDRAVMETGAQHIFVDSLSRLAQGMNLNENATATTLMDSIGGLGPSVNWIGHTGHENAHRLSGSKHFENAARLMVLLQGRISMPGKQFSDGSVAGNDNRALIRGVRTRVYKANGAAPTEPQFFTFEYHREYGLEAVRRADSYEWPVLTCDFVAAEAKERRECGRQTWDGVLLSGAVRCSRHRGEDDET